MPTFCRHNRFIERCPICSETVPELSQGARSRGGGPSTRRSSGSSTHNGAAKRSQRSLTRAGRAQVKVYDDGSKRGEDDGYSCELVPGLRSSEDALHLAEEIGFASARLLTLATQPPGLYAQARARKEQGDLEGATWTCFLIAYLSPLEGEDPFAGAREALAQAGEVGACEQIELDGIPLGPRTSHQPSNGMSTLLAYRRWIDQAGSQERAFCGDDAWSPERRFERLFERLALPGFIRRGRYDLLATLARLDIYELRAGALHLGSTSVRPGGSGSAQADPTTLAAKRVFGIGDPLLLERRALTLAESSAVSIDTLDLGLANWGSAQRATLGVPADACDEQARERTQMALGVSPTAPSA